MGRMLMSMLAAGLVDEAPRTPARIATGLWRRVWRRAELCVYRYPAERVSGLPNPRRMTRDRWEDLELFERTSRHFQTGRDEFLASVSLRRTQDHHLYTYVDGGRLLHYGWLIPRQSEGRDDRVGMKLYPEPDSAVLYDFYTHPDARGQGLYTQSLQQMLHDAVALEGAAQVYIYANDDNTPSRRVIEKVGFDYIGGLVREQRLWAVRRYATGTLRADLL
jgi:RimJ/RimL family protein N-acetyltransferase